MGARGRKSSAELSVIDGGRVEHTERPAPPRDLTDEQAGIWRTVVDDYPASKFPASTWEALAGYCRSAIACRRIAQLISAEEANGDEFNLKTYDRLLRMQRLEGAALRSAMVKLRIAPSTIDDRRKGGPDQFDPPWE